MVLNFTSRTANFTVACRQDDTLANKHEIGLQPNFHTKCREVLEYCGSCRAKLPSIVISQWILPPSACSCPKEKNCWKWSWKFAGAALSPTRSWGEVRDVFTPWRIRWNLRWLMLRDFRGLQVAHFLFPTNPMFFDVLDADVGAYRSISVLEMARTSLMFDAMLVRRWQGSWQMTALRGRPNRSIGLGEDYPLVN